MWWYLKEAFGRWLGHESRALKNGFSAVMREAPERSLASFSVWGCSMKMAICEPRGVSSPDEIYWCLDLGLLALRTVRNKYLLSVSHSAYDIFVTAAWMDQGKSFTQEKNLGWVFSLGNRQIKESLKIRQYVRLLRKCLYRETLECLQQKTSVQHLKKKQSKWRDKWRKDSQRDGRKFRRVRSHWNQGKRLFQKGEIASPVECCWGQVR